MTKAELIDAVAKGCKEDISKRALEAIIDCAFDTIGKAIKREKRFAFPGFGVFTVKSRKARTGVNPRTKEKIKIKASKTVGFKPAPTIKSGL
jgi:DNA-binding protein HU-beta